MEREEYLNGSQLLYQLLDNNIQEVEVYLEAGGNPNVDLAYQFKFINPITSNEKMLDTKTLPLEIAISRLYYDLVELLVQFGADISDKLEYAVRKDDEKMIRLVVRLGARLDFIDNVGKSAYQVAYYIKCYNAMSVLRDLGLSVEKYGGESFRNAASSGDLKSVEFFYTHGVDINFNRPDMVFPYASTPVIEAARHNDFDMVKWLVERGADLTITDKYGDRAYTCAIKNKNIEMAEYLRALEPMDWHNEEQKLKELKIYKLPQKLIDFLRGKELRFNIKDNRYVSYIVFKSLLECTEVKWKGYKFLDLLNDVDNYSPEGFLVWYPKEKCLASADYEHEEFRILDKWDVFVKDSSNIINKIFE